MFKIQAKKLYRTNGLNHSKNLEKKHDLESISEAKAYNLF